LDFHTVIGLIGVFCYLLAYALVQMRKLAVDADIYAWLNIIGGTFGLYSLSHDFNLASCISQSCWLLFTLIGMRAARKRRYLEKNKIPEIEI